MSSKFPGQDDEQTHNSSLEFGLVPSQDAIFKLLASQRRRYVLSCLKENEDPIALAALANKVAARENDLPVSEVSEEEIKHIHLSLYHTHIPKLNDADVVEYDQGKDTVTLNVSIEQLERYEELLPDR
jgi:hypothetical protein